MIALRFCEPSGTGWICCDPVGFKNKEKRKETFQKEEGMYKTSFVPVAPKNDTCVKVEARGPNLARYFILSGRCKLQTIEHF